MVSRNTKPFGGGLSQRTAYVRTTFDISSRKPTHSHSTTHT